MSTRQRLSLIGLYNYENDFGRDLFDKLELPEGYEKSTFVNTLLLEHGEKCVLYTDPTFFTLVIGVWSKKWALELSRIFEALTAEYNPIYNYDRFEESVDGRKKEYKSDVNSGARSGSQSSTTSTNKTQTDSNARTNAGSERKEEQKGERIAKDRPDYTETTAQTVGGNTERQISADNSSTYQPEWKETTNAGTTTREMAGESQNLEEVTGNKSNSKESSHAEDVSGTKTSAEDSSTSRISGEEVRNTNTKDHEQEDNEHRAHLYGNIGVTTSAAMVSEVVQQRINTNLYDIATGLFARELLLGIY